MKLSKHSKKRIKERTDIKKRSQTRFFRSALDQGISLNQAKMQDYDKVVIDYLEKVSKKASAKVYKGYTFIYSKNNKQLYTVYKSPKDIRELIEKRLNNER